MTIEMIGHTTYLYAVVAVRVAKQLLEASAVEQLTNEHLPRAVLSNTDALLDHVRAELLDGERADVAGELADDGVGEAVVVEVEDILDNLHKA